MAIMRKKAVLIFIFVATLASCGNAEQEATTLYNQGVVLVSEKDEEGAKAIFEELLQKYPGTKISVNANKDLIAIKERQAQQISLKVQSSMNAIWGAISLFKLDNQSYPESLNDLVERPEGMSSWIGYLEQLPVDPWGNPYEYTKDGKKFQLRSAGPDGQFKTDDDVLHKR